jgi:hypothetical protein
MILTDFPTGWLLLPMNTTPVEGPDFALLRVDEVFIQALALHLTRMRALPGADLTFEGEAYRLLFRDTHDTDGTKEEWSEWTEAVELAADLLQMEPGTFPWVLLEEGDLERLQAHWAPPRKTTTRLAVLDGGEPGPCRPAPPPAGVERVGIVLLGQMAPERPDLPEDYNHFTSEIAWLDFHLTEDLAA